MATLTPQKVLRTGLEATYASAAAGLADEFPNSGREIIHVVNGAVECNITIDTPGTVDGLAIAQQTITCTASEERFIGPFPPSIYNDSDDHVNIAYDDVSNVTIAILTI